MAEVSESKRGVRKGRTGTVVSKSGDKTVVVAIERRRQHPVYGKTVRYTKKFHVHDEKNEAGLGDKVRIVESRPMSRTKRWRLTAVVERQMDNEVSG